MTASAPRPWRPARVATLRRRLTAVGAAGLFVLCLAPVVGAASITSTELLAAIDAGTAPPILDVRSASEYARDHVPGALHAPFSDVTARAASLKLDPHAPVVVYCEHGPRALLARVALGWAGFTDVRLLAGHMSGWRNQRLRVATGAPPPASD